MVSATRQIFVFNEQKGKKTIGQQSMQQRQHRNSRLQNTFFFSYFFAMHILRFSGFEPFLANDECGKKRNNLLTRFGTLILLCVQQETSEDPCKTIDC